MKDVREKLRSLEWESRKLKSCLDLHITAVQRRAHNLSYSSEDILDGKTASLYKNKLLELKREWRRIKYN